MGNGWNHPWGGWGAAGPVERTVGQAGGAAPALLHAIADLCIVRGDDSGDELTLKTREIAERVIEVYWRQALTWPWR